MNKTVIIPPPSLASIDVDDLYDEVRDHWQKKAQRLQARRWRKLEQKRRWRRYRDNEFVKFQYLNKFRKEKL